MRVASPDVTEPPWAAVISVDPAGGGPRPLPGTASGSVGASVALVRAVALSDACGAIKLSVVVAVGFAPAPAVPLADAALSEPSTVGSEDDPADQRGPDPSRSPRSRTSRAAPESRLP